MISMSVATKDWAVYVMKKNIEKLKRKWRNTHTYIRINISRAIEGSSTMLFKKVAFTASCKLICDLFGKHAQQSVTNLWRPFSLQKTRTNHRMHSNAFSFFFSLFFISFSGFLSPKNFWHFKRFEFWRFVFFLLLLWNSSNNKTVADCLKGPSNGLQITSGLAFAKRPYAKIEIAKLMEKEGNSFSSGVFSVEKKKKPLYCFSSDRFFVVVIIQNYVYCTQCGSISCL